MICGTMFAKASPAMWIKINTFQLVDKRTGLRYDRGTDTGLIVLDGEPAVPCTRNPLQRG